MAATYGLVWTLVLADITKGLATNRYHSNFKHLRLVFLKVKHIPERNYSDVHSALLFYFWALASASSLLTFTSVVRFPAKRTPTLNTILTINFVLNCLALLMEFVPQPRLEYQEIDGK